MFFTLDHLKRIIPNNNDVDEWYRVLIENLPHYDINNNERIAAFIAQCAHESSNFTRITENLNYRWESLRKVFPKYFPTDELAKQYAHNREAIASRVYANRMGNGPEESGDGWRYKGRGLIQITGKNNYQSFADSIGYALEDVPEYLETFDGAVVSACWFWNTNNLNRFADIGDIKGLTRAINGGYIGLADRIDKNNKIINILS